MSNASSVADAVYQQNNGQPFTFATTKTAHQLMQSGGATVNISLDGQLAFILSNDSFPNRYISGLPFIVRAAGSVTGGEKYQIDICNNGNLATVVASTGLSANGLPSDNWLIEAECFWDVTSGRLRGLQYGWAGKTAITQTSINDGIVLTASSTQSASSQLTFCVGITIATANANALITVSEFSAELI